MSTVATANKTTETETIIQTTPKPEPAPKYKSWALMAYEADEEERLEREEEEREKMEKERQKMENIMAARRFLYSIGEYELEEGEILE